MSARRPVALGMAAALVWSLAIVLLGLRWHPAFGPTEALFLALLPGGLVMAALVARLAAARFLDPGLIDGAPFAPDSRAGLTQRVLTNTAEQLVLAVALWPVAALGGGSGLVLALGLGFGITRLAFWAGYAAAPPLRAFGFAGGFYATLIGAAAGLFRLLV